MIIKDSLLALMVIIIWGLNFVVIAWGVEGVPPLLLGGLRFLLVASIGSFFFSRPKTPFIWWCLFALPMSFFQFAFLFSAMSYGMPAGLASLALQSQALFTLLFAALFLKESIHLTQILAIFVAAIGLILIAPIDNTTNITALGFGLTMAGAISWGLGNISIRTISLKGYDTSVNLIIWSSWIPVIPFFICSYFFEGTQRIQHSLVHFGLQSTFSLLYISIISTIIGFGMWNHLLSRYPTSKVAPLTLGVPIVGLSSSSILLNEHINNDQWVGIVLVLAGLLINTFGKKIAAFILSSFQTAIKRG